MNSKAERQELLLRLRQWVAAHQAEDVGLLLTALVIGVGAGFGAILFRGLIEGPSHVQRTMSTPTPILMERALRLFTGSSRRLLRRTVGVLTL